MYKRLDSHAVHPVAERFFLACFLEIGQLLLSWFQRGEVVEKVAQESEIQLSVTFDDILHANELAAFHLLGVFQDELCKFSGVRFAQVWLVNSQTGRSDLLTEIEITRELLKECKQLAAPRD